MTNKSILRLFALTVIVGGLVLRAETISIDFNTFALKGEKGEMQGEDPTFAVGGTWNHVWLPAQNDGELTTESLNDVEGKPTEVMLSLKGPKISSWWSTDKLMPESKLYRDYMNFPKPAEIEIRGLKPVSVYQLGVFGYPLTWGNVLLELNGQSVHVKSGTKWEEERSSAEVLTVTTDAEGVLKGTVKGMWAGLHIRTEPLIKQTNEVVLIAGEPEKEKPPKFPPSKSVVYKTIDGVDLKLDVYLPEGHQASDRRPAIVFFHGGSWSGGWKTYMSPHCHALAARGMVAMTAEYRVTGRPPKSTPAECVKDAKSAIRWVRTHADDLGIDPERIAAGGGSAGGHMAAATAYLDGYNEEGEDPSVSCRPSALALFNPVIDNSPGGGYPYGPHPISERWRGWSPMHNITPDKAVPTLFFLGDQDHLIPVATGEEYQRITEAAGAACELHVYPVKHGFYQWGESGKHALERMDDFLVKHGFLQAP